MSALCPENVFTALKMKNADKQSIKRSGGIEKTQMDNSRNRYWVFFLERSFF